jgi:hypothetical protein
VVVPEAAGAVTHLLKPACLRFRAHPTSRGPALPYRERLASVSSNRGQAVVYPHEARLFESIK